MKSTCSLDRRAFITGVGLAAFAVQPEVALADGQNASVSGNGIGRYVAVDSSWSWDKTADIVIAGAGGAGASAAIAAAEAGPTVVVLEKGAIPGGSTLLSGQALLVAGLR